MKEDEYLDHSAGNGSGSWGDAFIDQHSTSNNDGRSETETTFYGNDVDNDILMSNGKRRSYERLWKINEGTLYPSDGRKGRSRDADRRRDATAFCRAIELTDFQKDRVIHLLDGVNLNELGDASSEDVTVALISLVANEDDRFIQREDRFSQLCEDLQIDSDKLKSLRKELRSIL